MGGAAGNLNLQPPQIHVRAQLIHLPLLGFKEDSVPQLNPQEPVWSLGSDFRGRNLQTSSIIAMEAVSVRPVSQLSSI